METAHLLRLLFSGILIQQRVSSWDIEVPKEVAAVEGSCVEVPCRTQPHQRVIWYKYDNLHYPKVYDGHNFHSVEAQFRGRTRVLGNASEGDCTLRINDVTRADSNLRVYVWINPDEKQHQKFYHQTVTIRFVEKKAPVLSIQEEMVNGGIFQANCSILHSCPPSPPSLRWNIDKYPENSTLVIFKKEEKGQWLYTESLQGVASYKLHQSKLACAAWFSSFTTDSNQATLNVFYEPINVTLKVEKQPVTEGHSVIVECLADCNPQPNEYSWLRRHMGQKTQTSSAQGKKSFNNIMRDTSVSCIARNNIGDGRSDWMYLDVQYAPAILNDSACHLIGDNLRCICKAEASPNASVYWTINGNDTLPFSFTSVSTVKNNTVSVEINGIVQGHPNVSCKARNHLGSDTKDLTPQQTRPNTFLPWLLAATALGVALLLGCTVFIYRRHPSNSLRDISDNTPQEERYENPQRLQEGEDTQATSRLETTYLNKGEVDRESIIYEIDSVEMSPRPASAQEYQNNASVPMTRLAKMQPKPQDMHCSADNIYLND